ncbi:sugar-transfer associated ATP-grasp domain-containing protein [Dongia deserti]|uniref:sugar-transfer associated ATP-grasp domain-containing protein n=1 Tax=Dongia deserti TaxID=2268030 RepID=UPI000E65DF28|nr:sugar-transfer associated ATP-grasp domain-containing protein [Dongia deserti]
MIRSKLRLRDVLRADVPAIYGALARDEKGDDRLVRRTYRFIHWLERGSPRAVQAYIVTPLPLLWAWRAGNGSSADEIHKYYLRALWREQSALHKVGSLLALLAWLPIVLAMTAWSSWLNGSMVRRKTGKAIARQALEQLWFAARHGMLPPWYYMFEMFDPAQQPKAPHYIHRYELKNGLLQILRRKVPPSDRSSTQNKIAFLKRCKRAGIRTLPKMAVVRRGKLNLRKGMRDQFLAQDLFVKPARGRGGEGAGLWQRSVDGYRLQDGLPVPPEELLAHLRRLSKEKTLLVQSRARNHSAIADLSNGALCTARIVTMRNESGGHEAVCALFRMAVGDNRQVDNFHAGGIAAPIDVATGRLGAATDWGLRPHHGWKTHHPDTGGLIEGRILPLWAETRALAERAHAAFEDRHIIGWDMAILEDGPAIVEANGGPDTDMHQRVSRDPLGNQRFGELLAFHLRTL